MSDSEFNLEKFLSFPHFCQRVAYCNRHLRMIGKGSSRFVYRWGELALKVAWNKKGLEQNVQEGMTPFEEYPFFTRIESYDDDGRYLTAELASKVRNKDFRDILGISLEDVMDFIWCTLRPLCDEKDRGVIDRWYRPVEGLYNRYEASAIKEKEQLCFLSDIHRYITNHVTSRFDVTDWKRLANWGKVIRDGKEQLVITDNGASRNLFENHCK